MDFLDSEITTINAEDLENYHQILVCEAQTPVKLRRLVLTNLMSITVSSLETDFSSHVEGQTVSHQQLEVVVGQNSATAGAALNGLSTHTGNSSIHVPSSVTWNLLPLSNGWINYGGGFSYATYALWAGWILLKGLVAPGTTPIIATLPSGFRPNYNSAQGGMSGDSSWSRINVFFSGVISCPGFQSLSYLSLDNIMIRRDDT